MHTKKTVLVTGGNGYLASWIIQYCLDAGYKVHATVRDLNQNKKLGFLKTLTGQKPGQIKLFQADCLVPGSFAQAMKGCSVVFHTASPFFLGPFQDVDIELIQPAIMGAEQICKQASQTPTVKRVILTSSCAAIGGDNIDILTVKNQCFTEDNWNISSSLTHMPYCYSKLKAEKAAWALANKQNQWTLVTINPTLIVGPSLDYHASSSGSFQLMALLASGQLRHGVPDSQFGCVDVRDVARAHLAAAENHKANGRFIINAGVTDYLSVAKSLANQWSHVYALPKRQLPKWLVWLFGPLMDKTITRRFIKRNVGYNIAYDNSKSKQVLGLQYRSIDDAVALMFEQMHANWLLAG